MRGRVIKSRTYEYEKIDCLWYPCSFHLGCIGMTVEQGMTHEQANQLSHYIFDDCLHIDDGGSVVLADGSLTINLHRSTTF